MKIAITGAAGFIGSSVAKELIERGDTVIGIDNLNDYYDPELKKARLESLEHKNFHFYQEDITDYDALREIASNHKIDKILHLAAQAGVRYSIENPFSYQENNNKGTLNLLEICRHYNIPNFIFASSSSVYGGNKELPFSEDQDVSHPVSLYAATKKNGELMCYTYHHLYNINCRCLRFFTVYGPWGRPDMALFKFTRSILENKPIDVYNYGKMKRDFTFIKDIVQGVIAAIDNDYQYEIFNLARGEVVELMDYIKSLEEALGKKAQMNLMEIQPGDVPHTEADISKAQKMLAYAPKTSVKEGVQKFVEWYKEYYEVRQ
ncbi:MAG: SDR family NAD(P)-dependent oxidoreductase [Candidatus Woesearchaeota archaeon]